MQDPKTPRILLVEDDKDQAFVVAYYLHRGGYQTEWCDSPKSAIKMAQKTEFHLILLDVMLNAEKDGFQLCRQFKSDTALKDIPIIMLTARSAINDVLYGFNLGADDYITKPFSKDELLARIRTVLKRVSFQKINTLNRELLDSTNDFCFFLNKEGQIETANRRAELLLPDITATYRLIDLFEPGYAKTISSMINQVMDGNEATGTNWRLITARDNNNASVDAKMFPLHQGDRITGVGCILKDSSQREQAFEVYEKKTQQLQQEVDSTSAKLQLMQQKLTLSEKMAALGQLAAGVAHELRNPLNVISTSLYYLKKVVPATNEKIDDHFGIIQQEIQRAQNIISSLLDFSRKSAEDRTEVDINEIIEQTLMLMRKELLIHEIKLDKQLHKVEKCYVNPDEMKQVFLNLLLNAKDAMPNGGTLSIRTNKGPQGFISIEFADTGHGIAKEIIDKIFDPFFTAKQTGQGIGIGLSIVHSAIERNKGTIEVTSQEGKGTTFTIHVPAIKTAYQFEAVDEKLTI